MKRALGMEEIELNFESEDAGVRRQNNLPSAKSKQNHQCSERLIPCMIDAWEDKMAKLSAEYGEEVSAKMKVAVLHAMLPKDLQEMSSRQMCSILGRCKRRRGGSESVAKSRRK